VNQQDWLAEQFETHRPRLRGVALRMLGSGAEADDAVQEGWLRLSRTGSDGIDNLGGWLTTVVGRVALDMLRSRRSRPQAGDDVELHTITSSASDPEQEAVLAASVGSALLIVLEALEPAERLALVLHDTFGVSFDEVGAILDRSPAAAKQLAYRARRKVRGADQATRRDPAPQRAVIDAFLAASRSGDFEALVALLHPDVVLKADDRAVGMGSPETTRGPEPVASMFSGRALAAAPALVDGAVGMVWAVDGRPRVVWDFTVVDGVIVGIEMIADPEQLARMEVVELY
jgi:RNA polymerase sigma-70 factor (ECF subfamily)